MAHPRLLASETRLRRREALGLAAGAALALGGCAAPWPERPVPAAQRQRVLIWDPFLFPFRDVLVKAWAASRPRFDINLIQGVGGLYSMAAHADVVSAYATDFEGNPEPVVDLRSYVQGRNVSLGSLVPGVDAWFHDVTGALFAVPIMPTEIQLYVNAPALQRLGFTPPAQWSWTAMRQAVELAAGSSIYPKSTLVVGYPWQNVNMWLTFVLGLGGTVAAASGQIHLAGAVDATRQLVDFAKTAAWTPNYFGSSQAAAVNRDFDNLGFQGLAANVLFGFDSPVSGYVPAGLHRSLPRPSAFPTFPTRPAIPASWTDGLAVSAHSPRPELAVQFVLWLLADSQQRLLGSLGLPPVMASTDLQDYWQKLQQSDPAAPRFQAKGYVEYRALLPSEFGLNCGGGGRRVSAFTAALPAALDRMVQGADVGQELAGLEQSYQRQTTAAAATSARCEVVAPKFG